VDKTLALDKIKLGVVSPDATFANFFVQSDNGGTENLLIIIKCYHNLYFIKIFTIYFLNL